MELSDITVGTVGGKDWGYLNSTPFGYVINGTVRPFTLYGVYVDPESQHENYSEYLKDFLLQYVTYSGLGGYDISYKEGPKQSISGSYKLAFSKTYDKHEEYGTYSLLLYDGSSVRNAKYSDLSTSSQNFVSAWHHATAIGVYTPDGASVLKSVEDIIRFDIEGSKEGQESHLLSGIPLFFEEDENSDIVGYLTSENPDPTEFGGTFGFSHEDNEDFNLPGDIIEGLFTDPGADLSDGVMRAILVDDENLKNFGRIIKSGWLAGSLPENTIAIKTLKTPGPIATKTDETVPIFFSTKTGDSIQGKYISWQFQAFSFGSIKIPESYGNFMDYTNTNIAIYLPYSGLHQLETKTVVNSTLTLQCGIDYVSGNIVYYLTVDRDGVKQVLYEFTGNSEMQTPMSALDYGQKITQFLSGIAGVTTALAMGPGATALTVGAAAAGAAENALFQNPRTFSVGNSMSNNGWCGIQYPFLVFTRSKVSYPDGYGEHFGYPSMKKERLGNLSGYTQVAEIHLDGINCLEEERKELEQLLKSGVIL